MTSLNRTQCSALRAIAILGIMLHNYCHWLGPAVKENEFTFTAQKPAMLWRAIEGMDLYMLPIHLLSFFGHYGVPVFLFLSAYGLVKKYESNLGVLPSNSSKGRCVPLSTITLPSSDSADFIWKHYKKLFGMMIFGFAAFLFIDFITAGTHRYAATDILAQLAMINNLLPTPDKIIWPGPYWFFGLMMQLYIVYRLLLYRRSSWWGVGLVVLCVVLQMLCAPNSETLNRLRYNCIGAMLPFVSGMIYARTSLSIPLKKGEAFNKFCRASIALLALLAIVAGSFNFFSWQFVPLAVCVLWVSLIKLVPDSWCTALAWLGNISVAIFVFHPITRKVFIPLSRHGDIYAGLVIYILVTIVLAYIITTKIPSLVGRGQGK